jgi:hypothetical protein
MFLAGNLLASEPMLPKTSTLVDAAVLGKAVQEAIAKRFSEAAAESYGVTADRFLSIVSEVMVRYAGGASEPEQLRTVSQKTTSPAANLPTVSMRIYTACRTWRENEYPNWTITWVAVRSRAGSVRC